MLIQLEEDTLQNGYGRPRMAFLILFEATEKLTPEIRCQLDVLRFSASAAWEQAYEMMWEGPTQ